MHPYPQNNSCYTVINNLVAGGLLLTQESHFVLASNCLETEFFLVLILLLFILLLLVLKTNKNFHISSFQTCV